MAQTTTTSGYLTNVQAAYRPVGFGVQIAWQRVINSSVSFFTVGTSTIGGADIIKSSGNFVAFFDKYAFTDYSQYVINWSVTRQLGQFPYGMIMSQADVQMDNTTGLFLPGKDATIGSGILPNRPIKISASIGSESLPQFTGFTGQPELTLGDRRLTLHAFDAMDYIQKSSITTSGTTTSGVSTTTSGYLRDVQANTVFQYILTVLGFSTNQYVLDQGLQRNYGFINLADRKYGDIMNDIVVAEQAMAFVDETGIFRFWNRQHFITTSGVSRFSLTYDNTVELEYENTPIINDVIVSAKPRAVYDNQKIWDLPTPLQIPPGAKLDVFANFTDDFGEYQVTSIDTPLYIDSATTSSFSSNTSSDGTGTASSSQISLIGVYNFGSSYKMTFRNNNSANAIWLTQVSIYGTPAKVTSVISQRYFDQTSIDNYGRNPSNNGDPLEIINDYIQDTSAAQSLAYTLVNEYGTARRRYKAKIFPRPELQIGDWGQVTIADTNETKNVYIVGTHLQMSVDAIMEQYLWLEERVPKSYFTVGTSLIQGGDQIAP